jgi:hypothetical protein
MSAVAADVLCISNRAVGVGVPIPTLPSFMTVNSVLVAEAVEEPMAKRVVLVSPSLA